MEETDRLRRLVAAEDGTDIESRLTELDDLETAASEELSSDLAVLDALAGETRYQVVRLLAAAGRGELTVAELDAVLGVSQSAVSHALGDLVDAGLVEARSEGTWRHYRTTDAAEDLVAALAAVR